MPGVEDKVKQIIVDQLSVEDSEVTPNASFVDDLGADSLDRVELIMAFQDAVSYIEKNSKIAKQ
jgi:acyl carrier protein